jgi:hypothetical protein
LVLLVSGLFHSCFKDEEFDEALLIGRWKPTSGTRMYFRYDSNGMGVTWNPNDDQREEEGQRFKWKLEQSDLEQRHEIEIIGEFNIIRLYTITVLNETTLKYRDGFSSYAFERL